MPAGTHGTFEVNNEGDIKFIRSFPEQFPVHVDIQDSQYEVGSTHSPSVFSIVFSTLLDAEPVHDWNQLAVLGQQVR